MLLKAATQTRERGTLCLDLILTNGQRKNKKLESNEWKLFVKGSKILTGFDWYITQKSTDQMKRDDGVYPDLQRSSVAMLLSGEVTLAVSWALARLLSAQNQFRMQIQSIQVCRMQTDGKRFKLIPHFCFLESLCDGSSRRCMMMLFTCSLQEKEDDEMRKC